MTPSALTPAARGTAKKSPPDRPKRPTRPTAAPAPVPAKRRSAASGNSGARSAGHRSEVARPVSPRTARRISGPLGGRAHGAAAPATAPAPTRPAVPRPAAPRPSRRRAGAQRKALKAARAPWTARSAAYVRALPEHALLDRIIRGRAWIPLLGVLLVGIVAMQVEVLKLNAGIGRSLDRATALQGQNEQLRASVSELSDEQRIESMAAKKGMVMAAPAQIKFLKTGAATTAQALSSIHQPNATSFDATLTAANTAALAVSQQAAATSATPSTTASAAASGASSTAPTSGGATAASTATSQTPSSAGTAGAGTGTSTGTTQTGGAGTGAAQQPSSPTTSTGAGTTTTTSTPVAGTTQQTSPASSAGGASIGVGAPPSGN